MPVLSFGTYQALIRSGSTVSATGGKDTFFYCPLNRFVIGGALFYLLLGFFHEVPDKRKRYRARYLVLVPGLVGLILYYSQSQYLTPIALQLQITTVCFLFWHTFQASRWSAHLLTVLVCVILTMMYMFEVSRGLAIGQGFISGLLLALPIVTFHWFIRNEVSGIQVTVGVVIGLALPFIPLLCLILPASVPWIALLFMLFYLAASLVPIACLVLWNRWARDVALGHFQENLGDPE
jgi:hypothetical protein